MITPLYKPLKKNGTTLYVFPSVEEDKNFESQNENYRMYLSHYVLVNFPKQVIGTATSEGVMDFEKTLAHPYGAFDQNNTSIPPAFLKDSLVESLRNYVANHEAVIRNSKINANTFYYDTFEPYTTTEKIFWKWCKTLNIIDLETADPAQEYFGVDSKYNNNGVTGNTNHYKEYLWKERSTTIYDVVSVQLSIPGGPTVPVILPPITPGFQVCTIQLTASTMLEPNDFILLNQALVDNVTPGLGYSSTQSLLKVIGLSTTTTLNDTIVVEIDAAATLASFGTITDRELYSSYNRFVQYICEVGGLNNVQLPDKAYTETFAYISHQHGQIPYALWNIKNDNNYKPNSQYPIIASEIQAEIQGGENPNNPILINPSLYPGDIWGHFDTPGFLYETQTGDIIRRYGNYYGNNSLSNVAPTLKYPDFDGSLTDGLVLNLNINDYAEAVSYVYPIESFNEFCATSFNNVAPKDFEFNAILWYYTIEDVTGNSLRTATNLYGVEFLDTPENDLLFAKTKIPTAKKLVSNGYQDGNAYSFSLDINIAIDSDTEAPSFDPDKVYSLFGMELFYEALTRITYFNDQLTNFMNSNLLLNQRVDDLTGLVYNQQTLESIRNRMNNLELLLNVYSTLQIGTSDTIVPRLDTSVNPPLLRLDSIDKQYGYVYQFDTKSMFTEFLNVSSLTDISIIEKTINVVNGKDFMVVINNNDNRVPTVQYDTTKTLPSLSAVINKDLEYKQKIDILIIPKINVDPISLTNPVNEPINDKKFNLFINYDDGTTVLKQSLGSYSLPVLKYFDGTNSFKELINDLTAVPVWKVRNVFYSKANTNDRVFSFIVEDDLVTKMPALSRIYIDNFFLEQNPSLPSQNYQNFSNQYAVYNTANNPKYIRSEVIDVEIINPGTGYVNGTVSLNHSISMPTYFTDLNITVGGGGVITNIEILNSEGLTLQSLVGLTLLVTGGNNDAFIRFIVKPVTRIDISLNINANATINTFLNQYDLATNVVALPLNTRVDIFRYMKMYPLLTLLKGYKISITRISDVDLPVSLIDQRYNVKIDRL
jgi:hypothetical protein